MDDHKKLDFIHKMAKLGLSHFDTGGIAGQVGNALGTSDNYTAGQINDGTNSAQLQQAYANSLETQDMTGQLANTLTPQTAAAVGQQNQLAAQLQAQANGQGPNVAQNQLNQATGANVSNQAALMAGQRGSSSNVGLMARQAAQQGAATQQGAAGQAATLGAQQQLNAQNSLASLSANQIGQTASAVGNDTNATQNEQAILQGANTSFNTATNAQSGINATTNAANQTANNGLLNGVASAAAMAMFAAKGGMVQKMASGGLPNVQAGGAPNSFVGKYLNGSNDSSSTAPAQPTSQTQQLGNTVGTALGKGISAAGKGISNLMSPPTPTMDQQNANIGNEAATVLPSQPQLMADPSLQAYSKGGPVKQMQAKGGPVKADNKSEKAKVKGNSYDNDTIPAMLSEDEIVLPREVTQHPNAPAMAAEFVRQTLAKKRAQTK